MLRAPALGLGLLLASAVAADPGEPLVRFDGHSWERGLTADRVARPFDGDRPPRATGAALRLGDRRLSAVGELTGVAAPLMWSPQAFSVSWHLRELRLVAERRTDSVRISEYAGGRITFYADSPTAIPDYGTYPPNSTVPSEFVDGFSVYLDAVVEGLVLRFDETRGTGTIRGAITFVGGDAFPLLPDPRGWELSAEIRRGSPIGFAFRLTGGLTRDGDATRVGGTSWTSIKNRYR